MSETPFALAKARVPSFQLGRAAFWLAISVAGAIAFYWSGIASLPENWELPEYSHGYLIPLIAIYLLLRSAANGHFAEPRLCWVGVVIVFVGIFLGLLGNLGSIPDVTSYALIVCIAGLVVAGLGLNNLRNYVAAVLYLVFMLRLPNYLYWTLSLKLQMLSSELGVAVISGLGVPVYLDGNIIDLGTYKLQVAEACSGLRYLFPLASFSFLFATLYRGPTWHRIVIFLSAVPITILMNSFRVAVIGILVDRYGIEQAEGFLHAFEGWIIFIACVAILYGEAVLLQLLRGRKAIPVHRMLEVDLSGVRHRVSEFPSFFVSRSFVIAAATVLAAGVAWQLVPAREPVHVPREQMSSFPLEIGAWTGRQQRLGAATEEALRASDYLLVDYTSGKASINFLVAYYDSQAKGSGIHSPQVCLPGGGWEISGWMPFETSLRAESGNPLRVNRAIIQKGTDRQLVYYWFEEQGRSVTSDYGAKLFTLIDAVRYGRTDGALIRLVTPIEGTSVESADRRLQEFLELTLPKLPAYVPS
jgi:exosortase D (VPLPA-CTERM-specific)